MRFLTLRKRWGSEFYIDPSSIQSIDATWGLTPAKTKIVDRMGHRYFVREAKWDVLKMVLDAELEQGVET